MRATAAASVLLAVSCARILPWHNEPIGSEVNLAFTLDRNLVELQTVRIDNRAGRFILGSATPRSVLDPTFAPSRARVLQMNERETVRITPVLLDLSGVADAIIGADAWGNRAITIDYRAGLVTYQKNGIVRDGMSVYPYRAEPSINVIVDGAQIAAIVDTASPDTLVLPRAEEGRGKVDIQVANVDFGATDVKYANVPHARIGNRLLSQFLVTIDYGRRVVGLWQDPRMRSAEPSP